MRARVLLTIATLTLSVHAMAADLKVLTAGAFKPVVVAVAADFERQTGLHLVIDNDTGGALARRIAGGEHFDVAVLPEGAFKALAKQAPGPALALARVGIGVAVKRGAAAPDISSVDAFRRALIDARAVAYIDPTAGGSSGVYLAQLFDKMGVASQISRKAVLVAGGLVAERVVSGEADLGIHQISEILAVPGALLVGPIPAEIQNYTVYAAAASATAPARPAQALLLMLRGEAARKAMAERGMEAVTSR
jgi:molybdate transport system substrate-binding protein